MIALTPLAEGRAAATPATAAAALPGTAFGLRLADRLGDGLPAAVPALPPESGGDGGTEGRTGGWTSDRTSDRADHGGTPGRESRPPESALSAAAEPGRGPPDLRRGNPAAGPAPHAGTPPRAPADPADPVPDTATVPGGGVEPPSAGQVAPPASPLPPGRDLPTTGRDTASAGPASLHPARHVQGPGLLRPGAWPREAPGPGAGPVSAGHMPSAPPPRGPETGVGGHARFAIVGNTATAGPPGPAAAYGGNDPAAPLRPWPRSAADRALAGPGAGAPDKGAAPTAAGHSAMLPGQGNGIQPAAEPVAAAADPVMPPLAGNRPGAPGAAPPPAGAGPAGTPPADRSGRGLAAAAGAALRQAGRQETARDPGDAVRPADARPVTDGNAAPPAGADRPALPRRTATAADLPPGRTAGSETDARPGTPGRVRVPWSADPAPATGTGESRVLRGLPAITADAAAAPMRGADSGPAPAGGAALAGTRPMVSIPVPPPLPGAGSACPEGAPAGGGGPPASAQSPLPPAAARAPREPSAGHTQPAAAAHRYAARGDAPPPPGPPSEGQAQGVPRPGALLSARMTSPTVGPARRENPATEVAPSRPTSAEPPPGTAKPARREAADSITVRHEPRGAESTPVAALHPPARPEAPPPAPFPPLADRPDAAPGAHRPATADRPAPAAAGRIVAAPPADTKPLAGIAPAARQVPPVPPRPGAAERPPPASAPSAGPDLRLRDPAAIRISQESDTGRAGQPAMGPAARDPRDHALDGAGIRPGAGGAAPASPAHGPAPVVTAGDAAPLAAPGMPIPARGAAPASAGSATAALAVVHPPGPVPAAAGPVPRPAGPDAARLSLPHPYLRATRTDHWPIPPSASRTAGAVAGQAAVPDRPVPGSGTAPAHPAGSWPAAAAAQAEAGGPAARGLHLPAVDRPRPEHAIPQALPPRAASHAALPPPDGAIRAPSLPAWPAPELPAAPQDAARADRSPAAAVADPRTGPAARGEGPETRPLARPAAPEPAPAPPAVARHASAPALPPGREERLPGDSAIAVPSPPGTPAAAPPDTRPGAAQPAAAFGTSTLPPWIEAVTQAAARTPPGDGGGIVLDVAPGQLGPLRIEVTVTGTEASVTISSPSPDAARQIAAAEPALAAALAAQGLSLAGNGAPPSDRQAGGHAPPPPGALPGRQGADPDRRHPHPPPGSARLVNLIA